MRYLIINDENELYQQMFQDLFWTKDYDVEEIPRIQAEGMMKKIEQLHFNNRINRHWFLPFKSVWKKRYGLEQYHFDDKEEYMILFVNGMLKYYFSRKQLEDFKRKHKNVKLCLLFFDSFSNRSAARAVGMRDLFDIVFSFDKEDCRRYGMEYMYSVFSMPDFVHEAKEDKSSAFFVGYGGTRLETLQKMFRRISKECQDCRFMIAGVKKKDQAPIPGVIYNQVISYARELQLAYNTNCIVEVVREGQSGITLRTCEAVAFGKKLVTNNENLRNMPFYDPQYMKIISSEKELDLDFIKEENKADYGTEDYFTPIKLLERIEQLEGRIL